MALAAYVDKYFGHCPPSHVGFDDHCIGVGIASQLEVIAIKGDGDMVLLGVSVGPSVAKWC